VQLYGQLLLRRVAHHHSDLSRRQATVSTVS
jgi:hypothetical protein